MAALSVTWPLLRDEIETVIAALTPHVFALDGPAGGGGYLRRELEDRGQREIEETPGRVRLFEMGPIESSKAEAHSVGHSNAVHTCRASLVLCYPTAQEWADAIAGDVVQIGIALDNHNATTSGVDYCIVERDQAPTSEASEDGTWQFVSVPLRAAIWADR